MLTREVRDEKLRADASKLLDLAQEIIARACELRNNLGPRYFAEAENKKAKEEAQPAASPPTMTYFS